MPEKTKRFRRFCAFFLCVLFFFANSSRAASVSLATDDAAWIAGMIFQNECNQRLECLVTWNEGEDFMSLGIGHFILYPQGRPDRYQESFPDLIRHFEQRGMTVPDWLKAMLKDGMPWKSREDFIARHSGPEAERLRIFLSETMSAQAYYMIGRFQKAILKMAEETPSESRAVFLEKVMTLTQTRNGLYAMIDYLNFKGDGLSDRERYHTHGWGLFQVLNEMKWPPGNNAESEFVEAARHILRRRVDNAPSERQEERWIFGWEKRVETYSASSDLLIAGGNTNAVILTEVSEPLEVLNLRDLSL